MRSFLAKTLLRLAQWVRPKAMPYVLAGPQWTGGSYLDSFRRTRQPTPNEMLAELKNTAWTCASINAATCANYPPKLYVITEHNQPQAKCATQTLSPWAARRLRSLPHLHGRLKSAARIEEVTDHPLLTLLQHANPIHTAFDLWELTTLYQEVHGSAYWCLDVDPVRNQPRAVWILPSQNVTPRRDPGSKNIVDFYLYRTGRSEERFAPEQIIHFAYPDPRDPYTSGLSPLRACFEQVAITSDYAAFKKAKFENHAVPDAIISPEEVMGEEERDRLETQWNNRFRRGGSGKVVVAESSLKVSLLNQSMGDLAALADMAATKQDICFAPGTLVVTCQGLKPIEEVQLGESVLTHAGRFRSVLRTMSRDYKGEMIRLRAKGLEPILCTPNHPWLATTRKDTRSHAAQRIDGPKWVSASELTPRMKGKSNWSRHAYSALMIPALRVQTAQIDLLSFRPDALRKLSGSRLRMSRGNSLPRLLELNRDLGRLIGLYLAEGSGNHKDLMWYFNLEERELAKEVQDLLEHIFSLRSSNREIPDYHSRVVQTSNGILASFFRSLGKRAPYKHVPGWALTGPQEFREGLLSGLIDGDGCSRDDGSITVSTSSRSLAEGLRLLLWSQGLHASISHRVQVESLIRGRKLVAGRPYYQVAWKPRTGATAICFLDGYTEFFLKEATPTTYSGKVYNLEVEEDNSYVTVGGTAHNCNAFHVPIAFLTSQTNLANLQASQSQHMSLAIGPRLQRRDEKLNAQLLPLYDPTGRLFLASEDPAPVDQNLLVQQQIADLKYGVVSINEVRSDRGLPPVPWGDVPWLPLQWERTDMPRQNEMPHSGRAQVPKPDTTANG